MKININIAVLSIVFAVPAMCAAQGQEQYAPPAEQVGSTQVAEPKAPPAKKQPPKKKAKKPAKKAPSEYKFEKIEDVTTYKFDKEANPIVKPAKPAKSKKTGKKAAPKKKKAEPKPQATEPAQQQQDSGMGGGVVDPENL